MQPSQPAPPSAEAGRNRPQPPRVAPEPQPPATATPPRPEREIAAPGVSTRTFPATEIGRGSEHAVVFAARAPRRGDRLRFPDDCTRWCAECLDTRRTGRGFRHIVRFQARRPISIAGGS